MRLFKLAIAPVIHKHVACGLVVMLGACASNSPDPHASKEPTRLDLSIAAAKDVNPDDKRRPAPIVVRVYEHRCCFLGSLLKIQPCDNLTKKIYFHSLRKNLAKF